MKNVNNERKWAAINSGKLKKDDSGEYRFSGSSFDAEALAADPTLELSYIVACPRMRLYEEYSSKIYSIYIKYVSDEDIVVYSIDEVFMDVNRVDTQLDDLIAQVKVLKKYRRLSAVAAELKNLSGRQAKHFRTEHSSELNDYGECQRPILEWYPSGHIPSVEAAEKRIHALKQEREQLLRHLHSASERT